MLDPELEHKINQAYEEHLDREWERYNEEGPEDVEEYDPYLAGEQLWELYDER